MNPQGTEGVAEQPTFGRIGLKATRKEGTSGGEKHFDRKLWKE
jgi:hypothetical protein